MHRRKVMRDHSKQAAVFKLDRQGSPEINTNGILIFNFQPPELLKNKYLLFMPHSFRYLIMAALAN